MHETISLALDYSLSVLINKCIYIICHSLFIHQHGFNAIDSIELVTFCQHIPLQHVCCMNYIVERHTHANMQTHSANVILISVDSLLKY